MLFSHPDTKFKIPKNFTADLPEFSLSDVGMKVSMTIAGSLTSQTSLTASRSALEADFHKLGSREVQPAAGQWMLEALTSEFAVLDMSLSAICTHVGVRKGRAVAFAFCALPSTLPVTQQYGQLSPH